MVEDPVEPIHLADSTTVNQTIAARPVLVPTILHRLGLAQSQLTYPHLEERSG
ncbi:MAG TPA: hypothetical protein VJS65_10540 [Verrucomicrobiae bacterium]|nr:hypothetical protein [Verrucomicrobiae bacterium]